MTQHYSSQHYSSTGNVHGRIVICDYCEQIEMPVSKRDPVREFVAGQDARIRRDIESELQWHPGIDNRKIGVVVRAGIVTLAGEVSCHVARRVLEEITRRVDGVKAIADEVTVERACLGLPGDADIAESAVATLKRHTATRWARIKPIVSNGCVTLTGCVPWAFQKTEAERTVSALPGVSSLINAIRVRRFELRGQRAGNDETLI